MGMIKNVKEIKRRLPVYGLGFDENKVLITLNDFNFYKLNTVRKEIERQNGAEFTAITKDGLHSIDIYCFFDENPNEITEIKYFKTKNLDSESVMFIIMAFIKKYLDKHYTIIENVNKIC